MPPHEASEPQLIPRACRARHIGKMTDFWTFSVLRLYELVWCTEVVCAIMIVDIVWHPKV
jgi:hypothetical protein